MARASAKKTADKGDSKKTDAKAETKKVVTAAKDRQRTQTGPFVLPPDGKIHIVNANAKAAATKGGQRFALYKNGMSVQTYIDASIKAGNRPALAKADLMWDFNHGFITVSGTSLKPLGAPARGRAAQPTAEKEDRPAAA